MAAAAAASCHHLSGKDKSGSPHALPLHAAATPTVPRPEKADGSPPRLERHHALDDFASTTVSWRDLHIDRGEAGASLKDQFKIPQTARQEVSRLQRAPTTLFPARQLSRGQSSAVMRKSLLRGGQVRTMQRLRSMHCGSAAARFAARAVRWVHEHPFLARSTMANATTLVIGLVVAAIVGIHQTQPPAHAHAATRTHARAPPSILPNRPRAGGLVDRTAREEAKPTTPSALALGVLSAMPALIIIDSVRRTGLAVMWSRLTEFVIMARVAARTKTCRGPAEKRKAPERTSRRSQGIFVTLIFTTAVASFTPQVMFSSPTHPLPLLLRSLLRSLPDSSVDFVPQDRFAFRDRVWDMVMDEYLLEGLFPGSRGHSKIA